LITLVRSILVADENVRWKSDKVTVEAKLIGDRPADIVAMAQLCWRPSAQSRASQWDRARTLPAPRPIPTSRCRSTSPPYGSQNALLTVLILTGLGGMTKPALSVRKAAK
jgi:tripeptide aminopeptidase